MNHKRLDHLRDLLKAEPNDPFLHYGIAMEHLSRENWSEALAALKELITRFPEYVPSWYQYGKLLFETGHPEKSAEILTQGIDYANKAGDRHAAGELKTLLDDVEDFI